MTVQKRVSLAAIVVFAAACPGSQGTGVQQVQGDLSISPVSLDYGQTKIEQDLYIISTTSKTINYELESDRAWLTVSPRSGTVARAVDTVHVRVSRSGLNANDYTAGLTLRTDNGPSLSIPVRMQVLPVTPLTIPEIEPNNLFAQANFFTPDRFVSGSIGVESDDDDWFRTALDADMIVTFTVSNTDSRSSNTSGIGSFQASKSSFSSSQYVFVDDNDDLYPGFGGAGNTTTLKPVLASRGDLYLRIRDSGTKTARYTMGFTAQAFNYTDTNEPNNDGPHSTVANAPVVINGTVGVGNDEADYYRINMPLSGGYRLYITNTSPSSISNVGTGISYEYRGGNYVWGGINDFPAGQSIQSEQMFVSGGALNIVLRPLGTRFASYRIEVR